MKDWIEKHVKKSCCKLVKSNRLGAFGLYAINIIKGIIEAKTDSGQLLAEKVDGIDKKQAMGT
ncbi:MAG: hypothetical protein E7L04_01045 [Anaerococcus sp.]|uniref:hypothetical protein n=1 Tax=Anaerococcus sp. TaxID=1872515 RepID=UPI002915256F|nr:hypothetical protein [Anaerococcus sp.]MDU5230043.1 hypothetical protein [Anaerococcus sp.]MDU7411063.1 hypothetical protein [Anaerococcus sp.]